MRRETHFFMANWKRNLRF